jgi:hypothetical protein
MPPEKPGLEASIPQVASRSVRCAGCEREVPLSEAVVPEASDYVAYFCGLDCYDRWRIEAGRRHFRQLP